MGLLKQFNLVIKCKKGSTNKLAYMFSRPPTSKNIALGTLMHMDLFTHDAHKEAYIEYEGFKEVLQKLQGQIHIEESEYNNDYHFYKYLLYNLDELCISKGE
jgi:hypothetical protein